MTNQSNETHDISSLPKQKTSFRARFTKKQNTDQSDTNETSRKGKVLHGVYTAGALLVVGGVVAAAAQKLGKRTTDGVTVTSTDDAVVITDTDN